MSNAQQFHLVPHLQTGAARPIVPGTKVSRLEVQMPTKGRYTDLREDLVFAPESRYPYVRLEKAASLMRSGMKLGICAIDIGGLKAPGKLRKYPEGTRAIAIINFEVRPLEVKLVTETVNTEDGAEILELGYTRVPALCKSAMHAKVRIFENAEPHDEDNPRVEQPEAPKAPAQPESSLGEPCPF